MGCDYNIIVHLEKLCHIVLKIASFNCKFRRNSTEVAKWVIVILCGPRACTRSCARPRAKISCAEAAGRRSGQEREGVRRERAAPMCLAQAAAMAEERLSPFAIAAAWAKHPNVPASRQGREFF